MTNTDEDFVVPADRLVIAGQIGPRVPALTNDSGDPLSENEIVLLTAVAGGAAFSERAVLEEFAAQVVRGERVNGFLQSLVNVLVAKAVLTGRLPAKKQGPTAEPVSQDGFPLALAYYRLVDGGMKVGLAVEAIANQFFLGERQVRRLAEQHRWLIGGDDPDERRRFREKWDRAARAINEHRPKGTALESNRPRRKRPRSDTVVALDSWIARALRPLVDNRGHSKD